MSITEAREGETPLVPFTYERDVNPAQIEDVRAHVRSAMERNWRSIGVGEALQETCAIVGGGPSLADYLDDLREFKGPIVCVNHTIDFLIQNGVRPTACVFCEIRSWKPSFLETIQPGVTYFPASQCHPETLDMLNGHDRVVLWHCIQQCGEDKIIRDKDSEAVLIGGGNSVYTRAINIMHCLGFRDFALYGCDSSFAGQTHVYHDRPEGMMEIEAAGKRFKTNYRLAMQADHLRWFTRAFGRLIGFKCHADGLFPHIHRTMFPKIYHGENACQTQEA